MCVFAPICPGVAISRGVHRQEEGHGGRTVHVCERVDLRSSFEGVKACSIHGGGRKNTSSLRSIEGRPSQHGTRVRQLVFEAPTITTPTFDSLRLIVHAVCKAPRGVAGEGEVVQHGGRGHVGANARGELGALGVETRPRSCSPVPAPVPAPHPLLRLSCLFYSSMCPKKTCVLQVEHFFKKLFLIHTSRQGPDTNCSWYQNKCWGTRY